MQIENGAKATFNVFGGLQAAIELTGALNWAPPKNLVALRTAPTMGIGSDKDAKKADPWLTLAKLNGSVGAALGAGFQGTAQISVDKGRFILNLKAAVVLGPGASFNFEIGYKAVVDIINLYRKELHKTIGRKIVAKNGKILTRLSPFSPTSWDVKPIIPAKKYRKYRKE